MEEGEIEKVDVIIGCPYGIMLFNERMMEPYIIARDKFLKQDGKMFPNKGSLFAVPFSDETLFKARINVAESFWSQRSFYDIYLSTLKDLAVKEILSQPITTVYESSLNMSEPESMGLDFTSMPLKSLDSISHKFHYRIYKKGVIHGVAFWFSVVFNGSNHIITLDTGPNKKYTTYYQSKLLIAQPLGVEEGQNITISISMKFDRLMSYVVKMTVKIDETSV